MANIKKLDCAMLPPCRKTLEMKIRRAQYVAMLWTNAAMTEPTAELIACEYGWEKDNEGILQPIWFEGPELPDCLFGDTSVGEIVSPANQEQDQRDCDEMQSDNEADLWSGDSESDSEDDTNCVEVISEEM